MIWPILEARAEIHECFCLGFFVQMNTSKSHSEIIWPLGICIHLDMYIVHPVHLLSPTQDKVQFPRLGNNTSPPIEKKYLEISFGLGIHMSAVEDTSLQQCQGKSDENVIYPIGTKS